MLELSRTVIGLFQARYRDPRTPDQGPDRLLTGKDPTDFNTENPLRLWIIQVGVIIMMTQLLAFGLRKVRQPKVIAEVLGGIILGPTAFGRIPGFSQHIFPDASRPYLSLVANIGLCLFLFLVGLEIDASVIKRNARLSATVALAGMALPFGLGAALSVPLYHKFIDPSIEFTHFMLFTGVAYSITAFPVLCRILTELKLLDTTVGIVVLSAGIGNDVIGWALLALSVALVNAGSGLTALYILLNCVGWTLLLLFPVKRALVWLARETGSTENGPTMFFMTVTILLLFSSAFFTDVIGVHAIFGAFLAGVIVPREGGLAIALTEKLEDMVSIIFLPLYFTLSGLSTDLGLLDDGITWCFTVAICALAFSGKFGGCTLAARASGFSWREASAIGTLMSCKGLVELIVLNVGLSAGILSPKVFSMFVLESLLLTFMTTPLVTTLYPQQYRTRLSTSDPAFKNIPGGEDGTEIPGSLYRPQASDDNQLPWMSRFTVVLDKVDHLPGMMALTQLINPGVPSVSDKHATSIAISKSPSPPHKSDMFINALRLIELSDRTSAVMKSSVADTLLHTDPLLGIFRMFGVLNDLPITTSLSIVTYDDLAHSVADHARDNMSQLVLVPWLPRSAYTAEFHESLATPRVLHNNPFDTFFKLSPADKTASVIHSQFVCDIFAQSKTDVALFIDRGNNLQGDTKMPGSIQHLYLPFFGGPDDRLALDFVLQLCANPKTSATVVRISKIGPSTGLPEYGDEKPVAETISKACDNGLAGASGAGFSSMVHGNTTAQTRMLSETADNVIWTRYTQLQACIESNSTIGSTLSRIEFLDLPTPAPLHAVLQYTSSQLESLSEKHAKLLVVTGRSQRLAVQDHHRELKGLMEEYGSVGHEVRKTVGDIATAVVASGINVGIVVLQTANSQDD